MERVGHGGAAVRLHLQDVVFVVRGLNRSLVNTLCLLGWHKDRDGGAGPGTRGLAKTALPQTARSSWLERGTVRGTHPSS